MRTANLKRSILNFLKSHIRAILGVSPSMWHCCHCNKIILELTKQTIEHTATCSKNSKLCRFNFLRLRLMWELMEWSTAINPDSLSPIVFVRYSWLYLLKPCTYLLWDCTFWKEYEEYILQRNVPKPIARRHNQLCYNSDASEVINTYEAHCMFF